MWVPGLLPSRENSRFWREELCQVCVCVCVCVCISSRLPFRKRARCSLRKRLKGRSWCCSSVSSVIPSSLLPRGVLAGKARGQGLFTTASRLQQFGGKFQRLSERRASRLKCEQRGRFRRGAQRTRRGGGSRCPRTREGLAVARGSNGLPGAAVEYGLLNSSLPPIPTRVTRPIRARPVLPSVPRGTWQSHTPRTRAGTRALEAGPAHSPRRRLGFEVRAAVLAVSSFLSFRLLCSPQSLTGPSREPQTPKVSARQPLPSKLRPGRTAARRRAGDQGWGITRKPENSRVQVRQEPDNNEE